MNLNYYWKHHHNKILACTLSGLALAIYLAVQVTFMVLSGTNYFSFLNIWSVVLTIAVYTIIFSGNLRNDPFAYNGVLMFIFMSVFDAIRSLIVSGFDVATSFGGENVRLGVFFIITVLFEAAMAVIGILLYVQSRRYMLGYPVRWKIIRLLSILFFACLCVSTAFTLSILLLLGIAGPIYALLVVAEPVSAVLIGLAIVFTMERLRRI